VDALSSILRGLRLESAVISRARFTAPWSVRSSCTPTPIFHAIVRGGGFLLVDGAEPVALSPGDVVLLTRGDAHVMCDAPATTPTIPIAKVNKERIGGVMALEHGGGGAETVLVCGKFQLDHAAGAALLTLLPRVLHAGAGGGPVAPWVETTLRLMEDEVARAGAGADAMLARLADVLFMQVLRVHVAAQPESARGWLAALRDAHIGRALSLIHDRPGDAWSAETLSTQVGLSRTRFFERFTELVGEPPARYVARWRMSAAADLLTRGSLSTAQIAERVGYSSEEAFTRVFKRRLGVSPATYRKNLRDAAVGARSLPS
jgi:AraC-like DNA-binding protein